MGLGSLIEGAKDLALFLKFRKRFKEDVMLKGFLTAAYALGSFVVVSIVAQLSGACPALLSALQPALLAGLGGAITFWVKPPDRKAGRKAALLGAVAAGLVAFKVQIAQVCGADFITQLPTLASMGVMVGLGLYLRSPKGPSAPSIDPKRFVTGLVALLALLGSVGCAGQLAQVSASLGSPKNPQAVNQKVVEGLVCANEDERAEVYLGDLGQSRAQITAAIVLARMDTAGRPGCACRETTCVGLKPAK